MKSAVFYLFLVALVALGCGTPSPKPVPWNLSISKQTPASIEVDLIGINQIEKHAWEGYDIDRYWDPNDLRRANANKLTMNLQSGTPWTVPSSHPKWREWMDRGATHLLVIANLPGRYSGAADPRRVILPLDKRAWDAKRKTLTIEVQDDIINVLTRQKG